MAVLGLPNRPTLLSQSWTNLPGRVQTTGLLEISFDLFGSCETPHCHSSNILVTQSAQKKFQISRYAATFRSLGTSTMKAQLSGEDSLATRHWWLSPGSPSTTPYSVEASAHCRLVSVLAIPLARPFNFGLRSQE
jgi:hypothetical protein